MDENEKIFIIQIINDYMVGLIDEGCPPTVINYIQNLKEKLIKILDEQQD